MKNLNPSTVFISAFAGFLLALALMYWTAKPDKTGYLADASDRVGKPAPKRTITGNKGEKIVISEEMAAEGNGGSMSTSRSLTASITSRRMTSSERALTTTNPTGWLGIYSTSPASSSSTSMSIRSRSTSAQPLIPARFRKSSWRY